LLHAALATSCARWQAPVAFELIELIDPDLAENASVAIRKGGPADATWVGDTTLERITAKLRKDAT
jgi:hypothetical protein